MCSLRSTRSSHFFGIRYLGLVTVRVIWLALTYTVLLLYFTLFHVPFIVIPRWASLHLTGEALKGSSTLPESHHQKVTPWHLETLNWFSFPHDSCLQISSHWVPPELSARHTKKYKQDTYGVQEGHRKGLSHLSDRGHGGVFCSCEKHQKRGLGHLCLSTGQVRFPRANDP